MTNTQSSPVRAIVTWEDDSGTEYTWPQALVDNRRSRVLARIRRFGIPCIEETVEIQRIRKPI